LLATNVYEMSHPLICHKISMMRDSSTPVKEFRELVHEVSLLLGYEATRDLPLIEQPVSTPVAETIGKFINKQVALVPILRAGLGMVDAMMSLIPAAKIGHIGLYRDHDSLKPVEYYCKLPPDIANRHVLVLDPMLATGGSASEAINMIKARGATHIKLVCIIAAPEGIACLHKNHPNVEIICGAIDDHLNEHGYIVPGLGDAGDRLYGTL